MTETEQRLNDRGFSTHEVAEIIELIADPHGTGARHQAAQLIHLIFLRVERDSPHGCALRRALGFDVGTSFAEAAGKFGVTKQYIADVQGALEAQLGPLAFIMREARAASAPSELEPAQNSTGPSPRSHDQR